MAVVCVTIPLTRAELLSLQRRFEEDKKRIARFKEGRKFKPY